MGSSPITHLGFFLNTVVIVDLHFLIFFAPISGSWCNGNITRLHRVAVSSILALPISGGVA